MKTTTEGTYGTGNEAGVQIIKGVVGDAISTERIRLFILGADGNIEIALNHALNFIEKEPRDTTPALEKVLGELAEEVKCAICLSYFSEPVALDCSHTFCLGCIEELVCESKLSCPLCRKSFHLDQRGAKGLKRNHYIANIVQKLRSVQATRLCACEQEVCTVYCSQCNAFLCETCSKRIHSKDLKNHTCKAFEDCYFKNNVFSRDRIEKLPWNLEYVISFSIKRESCQGILQSWMNNLWFAPSGLQNSVITQLEALYVPYWRFDCPTIKLTDNGLINSGRKVMVLATQDYVIPSLLPHADSWEEKDIEPFTGRHLEIGKAISISTKASSAWKRQKLILSKEKSAIICEVDEEAMSTRAKIVFVPVFAGIYQFRGKEFHFIINGSNGRCFGQRPYSTSKLSLSVGVGAAIGILTSARINL